MKKLALWLGVLLLWSPVLASLPSASVILAEPLGPRRLGLMGATLAYAASVGAAAALVGLLIALRASERPAGARGAVAALCLVSCALPGVAVSGASMGFASRLSPSLAQGWVSAWATHTGLLAPFAALAILSALSSLPREAVESATVLATPAKAFLGVVWPLLRSSVLTVAGLCALMAATDYGVPSLFGADTYALEVFADVSAGKPALASAWPMMLPALAFGVLAGPWLADRARPSDAAVAPRLCLPRLLSGSAMAAVAALILGLLGTVVSLVAQIPGWGDAWVAIARGRDDLSTTAEVALIAGIACTVFGLTVGPGLAEARGRLAWMLVLAPFAFPASLVGTAVAGIGSLRSAPELSPTILAHVLRFGGVAAVVLAIGWNRLDRGAVDAARVFLKPTARAIRVYPFLLGPFVTCGFLIAAILSVGELGATLMTIAPGRSTATIRLYNALHYGASDDAAAIGLCLCLSAGLAYAIGLTGRRRWAT
ncbi:MAG: hypothetical protein KIS66_08500 [Fimbriimonadaceae bacterium]|nr:hypothetical protein [Fimbriimonadaceae bacterium]